jgi:EmrB/QacA subfamily drug resistance transporter
MVNEHAWRSLFIVALAQTMVVLDATIVFVALPSIQGSLHMSLDSLQWVVNGYVLTFGGFLLLGGRLADLLGRTRLLVIGTVIFTIASALNAAAPSGDVLIFSRALQGFGGALVSPAALSVVATCFEARSNRMRAMSVWGALMGGSGAVGLVVGGALTQWLGWEAIFMINVPLGLIAIVAAWRLLPPLPGVGTGGSFDIAGAVTGTAGLVVFAYGIVQTNHHGWGSVQTLAMLAGAAALIGLFLVIEARGKHPLVRLSIFRIRALTMANLICVVAMGSVMPLFLFITIYVQDVLGFGPIRAGFAFLPYMVLVLGGSALSAVMMRKVGVRTVLLSGLTLAVPGLLLMSGIRGDGDYVSEVFPALSLLGIGMGLVLVPVTLTATASVGAEDSGLASGLYNTSLQIGGALGIAVLSTIAQHKTAAAAVPGPQALVDGYGLAFVVAACVVAAAVVVVAVALRRSDVDGVTLDAPGAALVA